MTMAHRDYLLIWVLRVPDLPPDESLTDWASCPQVTLVMMRPVVSTAQSMIWAITEILLLT